MSRAEVEDQRRQRDREAMEAEAARPYNPLSRESMTRQLEHAAAVNRAFNRRAR